MATEIGAWSTYIGGSAELIRELEGTDGLEVLPSDIADPFDGIHEGQTPFGSDP